jgi:membrane protease YdiL (CAAX protease family)
LRYGFNLEVILFYKGDSILTKRYWWIIIIYILAQFSGLLGIPLLVQLGVPREQVQGLWIVGSFFVAFILILILLIPDMKDRHSIEGRSTRGQAVLWAILGVFMVFAAQYIAIIIEMLAFNIDPGSDNTEQITEFARAVPMFIIVLTVIGPILEEIIFRLIIFGAIYKKYNFWIAAITSSLIFSVVHWDFEHTLVYVAAGLAFAFLYVKTKRILVPIIAHVAINTFVVLVQVVYGDKLLELLEKFEQIQQFIGGYIHALFT